MNNKLYLPVNRNPVWSVEDIASKASGDRYSRDLQTLWEQTYALAFFRQLTNRLLNNTIDSFVVD